jgi:type IV pilus assembly protein PilY1
MFDANNGDLLWWTSANATAAGGAEAYTNASAATINMKYSVVSQINAIDRDSDGLVDNLYFGDLGGQGFRVDLNNAATGADASAKKANFAKRVVRLFDEHATGGQVLASMKCQVCLFMIVIMAMLLLLHLVQVIVVLH